MGSAPRILRRTRKDVLKPWNCVAFGISLLNQGMSQQTMSETRRSRRIWKRRQARLRFRMPSVSQSLFGLLAFVAVLIQSLVVQTHIHHPAVVHSQLATIDSASLVQTGPS